MAVKIALDDVPLWICNKTYSYFSDTCPFNKIIYLSSTFAPAASNPVLEHSSVRGPRDSNTLRHLADRKLSAGFLLGPIPSLLRREVYVLASEERWYGMHVLVKLANDHGTSSTLSFIRLRRIPRT